MARELYASKNPNDLCLKLQKIGVGCCFSNTPLLQHSISILISELPPMAIKTSLAFMAYLPNPDMIKLKIDKTVKSRFKDWIPACAGMTSVVSI